MAEASERKSRGEPAQRRQKPKETTMQVQVQIVFLLLLNITRPVTTHESCDSD